MNETQSADLDLDLVRRSFPALDTPWALFDNAGGSVPARQVIERTTQYMSRIQVQTGASYELSVAASAAIAEGRGVAARLVNADEDEIVLGPSSTALVQRLASALRPTWKEGDEVIVTNLDHETNIGAWRALEATGIRVREWKFSPDSMRLELDDLEPLLNDRTRLVAFTHCANVVGTIHDAAAIAARVRAAGALSCVDGVAFAPHRQVDVKALGVDFYLVSLYKVFGPHVGLLYGRRDALLAGRSVNHFFIDESEVPYKYEPGGVVHELVAGVAGIGDYLESINSSVGSPAAAATAASMGTAFSCFARAEENLVAPLLDLLRSSARVTIIGEDTSDAAVRVPTVAFTVEGRHASEVPAALDREKLAVRFGHFYAHRAVEALGLMDRGGVTRVSLLHYNTPGEVARLTTALAPLLD